MSGKKPSFAQLLRRLRREAGLSTSKLATAAGLTRQYVGRLESGEQEPSLATAMKLARALNRSVAVFEGDP